MTLAALVAVAACGGKGGAKAPVAGAAPYAGVFVDGRATYALVVTHSFYDPEDEQADAGGNVVSKREEMVACTTAVRSVEGWQVAEIACTVPDDTTVVGELAGTYVAGPEGVWKLGSDATADAATLAALRGTPPMLAASPVPVDDRKESEEGFGEMRKVSAKDGGWCVETGSWGGDEGGSGTCFHPDRGITKVTTYWAGGSVHDESLELQ